MAGGGRKGKEVGVRNFSAREVVLMAFSFRAWERRRLKMQFCTSLPQPLASHIMGVYLGCCAWLLVFTMIPPSFI